jgi:hypothetical protein
MFLSRKPKKTFVMMDSTTLRIINELAQRARGQGCSMEFRLKEYKKAIYQLNKTFDAHNKNSAEVRLAKLEKAVLLLNKKLGFTPSINKGTI